MNEIKQFDNKEISSSEDWKKIRHNKNTKRVSMQGVSKNGKTKHLVIFNDNSSITVWV